MGGKTITRADLAEAVFRRLGLSRTESAAMVEMVLKEISDAIVAGETVKLSSFGSFMIRDKGLRVGRNPKTGREVPIPPRRVTVFKPSNIMKSRINDGLAGSERGGRRKRPNKMAEAASMKAPDAFRTISEVAEDLELPQHVLRFWETRFTQIKPMKRGGGRRYYRPEDVDLLRGVRLLLYGEGFTIRGVQRLLKDKGVAFVVAVGQTGSVQTVTAIEADDIDDAPAPPRRSSARIEPSIEPAYEPDDQAAEIAADSRATPVAAAERACDRFNGGRSAAAA